MPEPRREPKQVTSEKPLNVARADLYSRLMKAEDQIAQACYSRGTGRQAIERALDAVDEQLSDDDRREDLYLAALECYVEALGGRLEVRAVFSDDSIIIRGAPAA